MRLLISRKVRTIVGSRARPPHLWPISLLFLLTPLLVAGLWVQLAVVQVNVERVCQDGLVLGVADNKAGPFQAIVRHNGVQVGSRPITLSPALLTLPFGHARSFSGLFELPWSSTLPVSDTVTITLMDSGVARNLPGSYQVTGCSLWDTRVAKLAHACSVDVPVPFPSSNPAEDFATVNIATEMTVTGVDVTMYISHTLNIDVVTELESPTGTTLTLFNGVGGLDEQGFGTGCTVGGNQDFQMYLSDEGQESLAAGAAVPPYVDKVYRPENPLSTFTGEEAVGTWYLAMTDLVPSVDDGSLQCWCLTVYGYRNNPVYLPAVQRTSNVVGGPTPMAPQLVSD